MENGGDEALLDQARLTSHPAWRLGNVLDVRSAVEFAESHLLPAVSLPLFWAGTSSREPRSVATDPAVAGRPASPGKWAITADVEQVLLPIFLPPRHESLLVVAGQAAVARAVRDYLRQRDRPRVDACVLTADTLSGWPPELVARGPNRRRLWRPPEFLSTHAGYLPPPVTGPVLDLGSGNGRAAVWLAARGYRVTAVDRHAEALAMGRRLADSCGVQCHFLQRDLGDPAQVPCGPWSVILAFRYLNRVLFRKLPDLLKPNGVALVQTFRYAEDCANLPSRRYCLEPGELLRLFPPDRYRILVHEQGHDPDGKPAAGVVARLRASL